MHSSGKTILLAAGDYRAKIVSVGAGIAELTWQGKHLIIPHNPQEMPLAHLGKVLIPWPNRISNGSYHYDGKLYQLPINEHGTKASIHGLLAWRDWQIDELTDKKISLTIFLPPSYGYPFSLISRVTYSLDETTGLSVDIISENIGEQSTPYGVGVHPYLTCNLAPVDDYFLQLPATEVFAVDAQSNPTILYLVDDLDLNFSQLRKINGKQIDHTFKTQSHRGIMKIVHQQQSLAVTLYSDQPWLQVYSGEKLGRRGLAIEPMSCPPNAFNSEIDLIMLEPGQKHQLFFNIQGEEVIQDNL